MLIKHLQRIPALERALRLSRYYRRLCGFRDQLPCQRTWYRRFQQLESLLEALKTALFDILVPRQQICACDATALEAFGRHVSKQSKKYKPGDRDGRWGKTVTKGWFQGYKLHCLTSTSPRPIPLAWKLETANTQEANEFEALLQQAKAFNQLPRYLAADKAYDSEKLFQTAKDYDVFLAASLRKIRPPNRGSPKATASRPFRKDWSKSLLARYVAKRRSDIERCFGRVKQTFLLDPLPVRHRINVEAYTHLCLLGYLTLVAFNVAHKRPALRHQELMCSF